MLFKFLKNQEMLDFKMLRNTQGLQAPLKLQMERAVASKVNHTVCSTICNHTFCIIIIVLLIEATGSMKIESVKWNGPWNDLI